MRIDGLPRGAGSWRQQVVAALAEPARPPLPVVHPALRLHFTLRPRQFVDLDTLVVTTVAGLREAGLQRRGLPDLDIVLATRAEAAPTGAVVRFLSAAELLAESPPGPAMLEVSAPEPPGTRAEGKRAWRERIAAAWGPRSVLEGPVWAEVLLGRTGSLLAPLEPVLDALEPVLGRDPRGRDWQEFFPTDDRIVWLRIARAVDPGAPLLRLRLGNPG